MARRAKKPAEPEKSDSQNAPVDQHWINEVAPELLKLQQSTGWKILMHYLRLERTEALLEFPSVDPTDAKKIEDLQRRISRFDYFANTIDQIISEGLEVEDAEIEAGD